MAVCPKLSRSEVESSKAVCLHQPSLVYFLTYTFQASTKGIYIHTRHDGKLFNLARLRAKTRSQLFADDAALASHTEDGLQ